MKRAIAELEDGERSIEVAGTPEVQPVKKHSLDFYGKNHDPTNKRIIMPDTVNVSTEFTVPIWDETLMSILSFACSDMCERNGTDEKNKEMEQVLYGAFDQNSNMRDLLAGNALVFPDFDVVEGDFVHNSAFIIVTKTNPRRDLATRRFLQRISNERIERLRDEKKRLFGKKI